MKNIAPDIYRQRLLIEGYYSITVTKEDVGAYLSGLAQHLNLRAYGEPIIYSPATGMGKAENQGFDGFVPLIDSGMSVYIWTGANFFSVVLYTCKGFDEREAIAFTREYFQAEGEVVHSSF